MWIRPTEWRTNKALHSRSTMHSTSAHNFSVFHYGNRAGLTTVHVLTTLTVVNYQPYYRVRRKFGVATSIKQSENLAPQIFKYTACQSAHVYRKRNDRLLDGSKLKNV